MERKHTGNYNTDILKWRWWLNGKFEKKRNTWILWRWSTPLPSRTPTLRRTSAELKQANNEEPALYLADLYIETSLVSTACWRQARLTTFYKFHHGLVHIESRYCPSKSDHPRRTNRHSYNLTPDIPSHWTAYIYTDRWLSFLGLSQSGTVFPKKWPQHPHLAPLWPGSAPC